MTNRLWGGGAEGRVTEREGGEGGREDRRRGEVTWRWERKIRWEKRREDKGGVRMILRREGKGGKGSGERKGRDDLEVKREGTWGKGRRSSGKGEQG